MHPHESANFLSKLFFCWTLPIFLKGYKNKLDEYDLHGPLANHESKGLGDKLEEVWLYERSSKSKPSLIRAIWKVFRFQICFHGIILFVIELGLKLAYPLCLGKLLEFYIPNQSSASKDKEYMYGFLIILASFINVLLGHNYMMVTQHLGMKIRVACCSLVYRKSLKLSKATTVSTTAGQMINLLSNDVRRFDTIFLNFHNIWTAPLQILITTYLLYTMVGIYALTGIGFFLCFIPIPMFLGKKSAQYRLKIAKKTDERVRLMDEIISGIQVIKMYTWEKPFAKLVDKARKYEIQEIRATSVIRAILASLSMYLNRTAVFISILTYTLAGNVPQAYYVFVVTSFYNVLRQSMVFHIPQAMSMLGETSVSIKRIENFLMDEEITEKERSQIITENVENYENSSNNTFLIKNSKESDIVIENVSAKWNPSLPENTLSNINFMARKKELVAVIGTIGGGKSSLLQVILKELPILEGTITINGTISYASQTPWLFPRSIRENILFGQPMDQKRYKDVCQVCALERDFSLLPHGDQTIVGERGATLSGGQKARISLARAVYKDADIYLLDDPLSAVDANVGKQLFDQCLSQYLKNKCVVLVTHQLQYLTKVHRICVVKNGMIESCGTFEDLNSSDDNDLKSILKSEEDDKSNLEIETCARKSDITDNIKEAKEQKQEGAIENKVYGKFIKAGGGYFTGFIIILIFIIAQLLASFSDYFITYWVNLEQRKNETMNNEQIEVGILSIFVETESCVYFYTILICSVIVTTFIRSISFIWFCMNASKVLHFNMFSSMINTTITFFRINPSGRVLNRFSKDIGSIDEVLPIVILETLQVFLNVISITVIVSVINPWILIPTGFMLVIFYWMKVLFLASSRELKRMEATTKSPIFSLISTSMQGLPTIRAFGAQENLKKEFDNQQNVHSSAFYMFLACNRAFGFWLDLLCVIYVGLVIMGILFMLDETFGGNVGLAITQSLALTGMFQWGIRQWSELDNQMIAVERVTEYAALKPEPDTQHKHVSTDWPDLGGIRFNDVSFRYSLDGPFVLKNLSFIIKPKEKVGIIGRTGAGKSSLIAALFRLGERKGEILIDNVDIQTVALQSIRSKISIIPQDPVLFSGTLRRNLDPLDQYQDSQLWNALREVELENVAFQLPSGLNSKVSEGGSNFSVGQRQLICLARAIIGSNKILVLDEATANVDPETDILIQRTIREKFQQCTVLTIAHRLHTVMDSDRILVLHDGCAVEFEDPHILLQNKNSTFYGLVSQTGESISQVLMNIAEKTYNQRGRTDY